MTDAGRFSVVVVDDEPLAREGIRFLLEHDPDVSKVVECADGEAAIETIRLQSPDVVFLDVQMPETPGLEVIRAIGPEQMPVTVFVTAHDKYAVEAFEVQALDYLLKPYTRERFAKVWQRAKEEVRRDAVCAMAPRVFDALRQSPAKQYLKRIAYKSNGRTCLVFLENVDWFEAEGNYVRVHTGRAGVLIHATMQDLERRLDPEMFVRIHRSRIVNLRRIRQIQPVYHGEYEVVLQNDLRITTGRRFRKNIEALVHNRIQATGAA